MATATITPPDLHHGQSEVAHHSARFRVLACGRRWGKTRLGSLLCLATATRGGRAWWVAPSFPVASVGWRLVQRLAKQIPGTEIRQVDRMVILPGGGVVQVKSADNPDSLRGEGLDFLVMDECAFTKEEAWSEALRPALSDRKGKALFISTPKGHNWFWRAFQNQYNDPAWHSWQFPTASNPFIDPAEIEAARRSLPERVFAQEYQAEFIADAGGVFRRVMDAATGAAIDRAEPGREYIFGVDWGKHNDFTVISVLDTQARRQVALDRFNQIDYAVQMDRLRAMVSRYNPAAIIAESNSMGEPLVEQLQRDGLPVSPFQTTNASKAGAIEALALAFERQEITILNDPVQVGELQAYELERLPSGLIRYAAPDGMHDDTVMALALAWQGVAAGIGTELDIVNLAAMLG